MAKYTTEVRSVCESFAGLDESVGYSNVDTVIDNSRAKIFDFPYPIFDIAYKPILEKKILMHYYTREICEETVGLWKLRLRAKLNEIMPYYNKLYESELLEFNPLYDTDYHKEGTRNEDTDNTTENNLRTNATHTGADTNVVNSTTGGRDTMNSVTQKGGQDETSATNRDKYNEWNLYSDTPQGGIEGILGAENEPSLLDDGYLTNARHILHDGLGSESSSTTEYGGTSNTDDTMYYGKTENKNDVMNYNSSRLTTNTGDVTFNGNTIEDYAEHVYGKMPGKSMSKMLLEFRETFLNIDMQVIDELKNLFFNLW